MNQLKHKGDNTTHNRVLITTSDQATELAKRWNCTKVEVYRWLVQQATDGKIQPAQPEEE